MLKQERIQADLLIAGASLAGLSAAITAKEQNPELDVLVVEKYFSGYAGKANRGGGIMLVLKDGVTPEEFVTYHTTHLGRFLNKQDLHQDYASKLSSNLDLLDKWSGYRVCRKADGLPVCQDYGGDVIGQDDQGRPILGPAPQPWTLVAIELDYILEVKKYARKLGIRFMDRIGIVDLATREGRVVGAIGYHIEEGTQYAFGAKAVILATGSQDYRILPMWAPARGEGIAAAWRAGARMSNCEFGSFFNWISTSNLEATMGVEDALFNSKGEQVGQQFRTIDFLDVEPEILAEWYIQMKAGNGPMHYRMEHNKVLPALGAMLFGGVYDRPFASAFWGRLLYNAMTNHVNDEIVPGFLGELSPLWVDSTFQTSVPGLFGAGDICYSGSGAPGAVPAPPSRTRGGGLPFALYSGREAGASAAAFAASVPLQPFDSAQLEASSAAMFRPMGQVGGWGPNDLLQRIHAIMNDLGFTIYRHEDRLQKALRQLEELESLLPRLRAADMHEAFLCNEVRSMVLCAQFFFRTSLERKESRGWFLREDYPERDDQNWLKWSFVTPDQGGMRVSFEPVPIETYPCQPAKN